MKTVGLLDGLEWHNAGDSGRAQAIHYDEYGRALRWALRRGQTVREFTTQRTPIYLIVPSGRGTGNPQPVCATDRHQRVRQLGDQSQLRR